MQGGWVSLCFSVESHSFFFEQIFPCLGQWTDLNRPFKIDLKQCGPVMWFFFSPLILFIPAAMLKYEITINLYWVEFTQDRFNLQYPLPGTVGVGRAKTNLGVYPGAWTDIVQLILILPFRDLPPLLKKKKAVGRYFKRADCWSNFSAAYMVCWGTRSWSWWWPMAEDWIPSPQSG